MKQVINALSNVIFQFKVDFGMPLTELEFKGALSNATIASSRVLLLIFMGSSLISVIDASFVLNKSR